MSDKDTKIIQFPKPPSPPQSREPSAEGEEAQVIEIENRRKKPVRVSMDGLNFRVRGGEIELIATVRGREIVFSEGDIEKWAKALHSAAVSIRIRKRDQRLMRLWLRACRGEDMVLPDAPNDPEIGLWQHERDAIRKRLKKSSPINVARSLYQLGLESHAAARVAEDLTGRRLARNSDPSEPGDTMGYEMRGRIGGTLLVRWWYEQQAAKGIVPLALMQRSREADEALRAAQDAQQRSGVPFFTYNRRKWGWEVWIWRGGWGNNLTSTLRREQPIPTREAAIAFARAHAAQAGFAYAEQVRLVGLAASTPADPTDPKPKG